MEVNKQYIVVKKNNLNWKTSINIYTCPKCKIEGIDINDAEKTPKLKQIYNILENCPNCNNPKCKCLTTEEHCKLTKMFQCDTCKGTYDYSNFSYNYDDKDTCEYCRWGMR